MSCWHWHGLNPGRFIWELQPVRMQVENGFASQHTGINPPYYPSSLWPVSRSRLLSQPSASLLPTSWFLSPHHSFSSPSPVVSPPSFLLLDFCSTLFAILLVPVVKEVWLPTVCSHSFFQTSIRHPGIGCMLGSSDPGLLLPPSFPAASPL